MNIIVLDGYTLNPGDLSWDALNTLGTCELYERTPPDRVTERCANAEIVLTNKTKLTREIILNAGNLKYVGILATGTNVVDLAAARERGVTVTNVPAYATDSVAQLTYALLLELTSRVGEHSQSVRSGDWSRSVDFSYWKGPLLELSGHTLGLIGFGHIAQAVARIGLAFGMKLMVNVRKARPDLAGICFVDQETLFRQSDFVSLHCPLTTETEHLINAKRLGWMKSTSFLLNTGRGGLIDEAALANALNAGQIGGAGLDVLSTEPPSPGNPLVLAKNCIITPHVGWATHAARSRLMRAAVENVVAFLNGTPQNIVS